VQSVIELSKLPRLGTVIGLKPRLTSNNFNGETWSEKVNP